MRIVVRSTNWIGDAVMSIPALREVRRAFPIAEITLCARSWVRDVFSEAKFVDRILICDSKSGGDFFRQVLDWRKERFDLAILFTNSFESALLARLGGAGKIFGYSTQGRGFLLTEAFPVPSWKSERHEVFYYLNLVEEIQRRLFGKSKISENPDTSIYVSEERKAEAREILENYGVDFSRKVIAFGVGSKNSLAKRWQIEKYAKLNDLLQFETRANVLVLGAREEIDIAEELAGKAMLKPIILNGKISLAQTIAVLSQVNLLISNDIGLAHLAPAVGTKTLVIFGPTNEKATQPIGAEIIRKNVECAPCMKRICPIDHRCMKLISAEEVFKKALKMLSD